MAMFLSNNPYHLIHGIGGDSGGSCFFRRIECLRMSYLHKNRENMGWKGWLWEVLSYRGILQVIQPKLFDECLITRLQKKKNH